MSNTADSVSDFYQMVDEKWGNQPKYYSLQTQKMGLRKVKPAPHYRQLQLVKQTLKKPSRAQSRTSRGRRSLSVSPFSVPRSLTSCCLHVSVLVINLFLLPALLWRFSHESCSSFVFCSFRSFVVVRPDLIGFTSVLFPPVLDDLSSSCGYGRDQKHLDNDAGFFLVILPPYGTRVDSKSNSWGVTEVQT